MNPDEPIYGATPRQAAARFWSAYWIVFGRASRSEFWWWTLIDTIIAQLLVTVPSIVTGDNLFWGTDDQLALSAWPSNLWALATAIGSITLTARRLHDVDRSGWWQLLVVVPVVGWIILIVWLASAPKPAGARFDRQVAAQAAGSS